MAALREWWMRGRARPVPVDLTIDDNAVHLYVDEASLADRLESYVTQAWLAGQRTVVFADHQRIKELRLRLAAWHMEAALEAHDSTWALGQVILDGLPSQELFNALIEHTLGRYEPGTVRLYSEMVSLLWLQGSVSAALSLQTMWHAYLVEHPVPRLTVYAQDASPEHLLPREQGEAPTGPGR